MASGFSSNFKDLDSDSSARKPRFPFPVSLSELQSKQDTTKMTARHITMKSGNLRIGDIILLKFTTANDLCKYTGFISADGVISDTVDCIPQSSHIEKGANVLIKSCLFRVEKARLTDSKRFNPFEIADSELSISLGKSITYGERIQLRHIHSGGFVTVCRDSIAIEPGCLKIYIGTSGNDSTWFEMKSMQDLKSEGECISYKDVVYLKPSCIDSTYYIHCNTYKIRTPHEKLEVNACVNPSAFKPRLYMLQEDFVENSFFVTTGNAFRVYHRITEGYLSVSEIPLLEDIGGNIYVQRGNKTSNSLWELQRQAAFVGGTIKWNETFRIKHLASGLFLKELNSSIELTADGYADGTLFNLKSDAETVKCS